MHISNFKFNFLSTKLYTNLKTFKSKFFSTFLVVILAFNLPTISSIAQVEDTAPTNINLAITKVLKDGRDQVTEKVATNKFVFNDSLNDSDSIKYSWDNTRILTNFKDKPALCCGFINVYLEDETKEDNFLFTTGSDDYPIKVSKLASKLKSGKNTVILVFFNHTNKATSNKSSLTFDYVSTTNPALKPVITVIKPGAGAVFSKEVTQPIVLDIENFTLSKDTETKSENIGKLNIYANDTTNLLETIDTGSTPVSGKMRVEFKPETITKFEKLPDSKNTKLIFQLVSPAKTEPVVESTFEVITNFNKSTDLGLPSVKITDPSKESTVASVTEDKVFLIDYQNFTTLEKEPIQSNVNPSSKEGFIQIFVNNVPIVTKWPKKDFTLKEIGYFSQDSGEREVKVQLVNVNYEKLSPDASDKVKIQYVNNTATVTKKQDTEIQSSNWKIIIIVLTVILIVGGILISITKS
jgi:hypothetical protein